MNNAGLSTFGEVEWCNMQTYQRIADVNVWGGVRVVKAFLPLIRKAKGEGGLQNYEASHFHRVCFRRGLIFGGGS